VKAAATQMADKASKGARKNEVVTREYTVNLHKRLHGWFVSSSSFSPPFFYWNSLRLVLEPVPLS
jgi:hypothetical protein